MALANDVKRSIKQAMGVPRLGEALCDAVDDAVDASLGSINTLTFTGATGVNEIVIPTNLADALSVESSAGDVFVVDTTTGAVAATLTTTAAAGFTCAGHLTMGDAKNVILNTTTGTKIGTAATQKLGFWNATPIVQPSGASQAALTHSVGTADGTVDDVGAAFNQTTLNNNFKEITTLLGALRTALVDAGIIKGAA